MVKKLIILLSLVLLFACSSDSTKTKNFAVKGSVTLNNSDNNSNVTVAVFSFVKNNASITTLREKHPQVGFLLNQNYIFDHRYEKYLKITKTNESGNFSFNLANGSYNIVYYKNGYGFNYSQIQVENATVDMPNKILNPEVLLTSPILQPLTLKTGTNYYTLDDVVCPEAITAEKGAILRIAPNKNFETYSSFTTSSTQEEPFIITTNDACSTFSTSNSNLQYFNSFKIVSEKDTNIQHTKISHINEVFKYNLPNNNISNCYFEKSKNGIYSSNIANINVSNCIFNSITQISLAILGNSTVNNNIFYNANKGLSIEDTTVEVTNNAFTNNYIGVQQTRSTVNITNNLFDSNNFGISLSAAKPVISFNNFTNNKIGIETCRYYIQGYSEFSKPTVTKNNFFEIPNNIAFSDYGENPTAGPAFKGKGINTDIDIKLNYFAHSFPSEVITNKTSYTINFEPQMNKQITEAGVK